MHPSDPKTIALAAELPHRENEAAIEEAVLESESEAKPEPLTEIEEAVAESETIETLTMHDPYIKALFRKWFCLF